MADQQGSAGRMLRAVLRGALVGGVGAVLTGAAVSAAATALARRVVTPEDAERPDDVEVLAIGAGTVTLRATAETVAPGRYGLWTDAGQGHARLGEVVDHDEHSGMVTRRVLGVDAGRLRAGPARWNQYFYAGTPGSALELPYQDVEVDGELGPLPAWLLPADRAEDGADDRAGRMPWAVLVHGRGATREECLRALPVLHRLGYTCLVVSYRNDPGVVTSPGRRYHLGESEWRDVEDAVVHALAEGASDVVLVGWSMGGAIALQLLDRSWTRDRIRAVVLDAPVLDWRDVLDHHARMNRVPAALGRLSQGLLGHAHGRRLAALDLPVPLDRMDWVARAPELSVPLLVLHSDDDEFVPCGPSRRLARARPDLVTLVSSRHARHTKEWNVDPAVWDTAVARFLLAH